MNERRLNRSFRKSKRTIQTRRVSVKKQFKFKIGNKSYQVFNKKLNFFDSIQTCFDNKMIPYSPVGSRAMQRTISRKLKLHGAIWIDGNDIHKEKIFRTLSGKKLNLRWVRGESNNSGGKEHCLQINGLANYNDLACSAKQKPVCVKIKNYNTRLVYDLKKKFKELLFAAKRRKINFTFKSFPFNGKYHDLFSNNYRVYFEKKNYLDAAKQCHHDGMVLASSYRQKMRNKVFKNFSFVLNFWIGVNDLLNENQFKSSENKLVDIKNFWPRTELNNQYYSEDCIQFELYETGSILTDAICDVKKEFLCTKKPAEYLKRSKENFQKIENTQYNSIKMKILKQHSKTTVVSIMLS